MALALLKKGIDTFVYDSAGERIKELEILGAKAASSGHEIGVLCDYVVVMVRDTAQVEAVLLGKQGVLESSKKGSIILIMSTVDPLFCQRTEKIAAVKGIGLLDAPVSGAPKGAEAQNLTIMVGGEKYLLEKCRPILEAMGNRIIHVGGIGMGQVAKIANNSIVLAIAIATAGGITLAKKGGVEADRFLEIIQSSTASSWVAHNWEYWRQKASGKTTDFGITYKDLHLALDLAKSIGVPLPLSEAIGQLDLSDALMA
jgi:3-hydroxyisobutyrate dehydrogenase